MARVYTEVDLDDFYSELTKREKQELLELLGEDGLLPEFPEVTSTKLCNDDFNLTCLKLSECYYQMSDEEINLIESIVKKYG